MDQNPMQPPATADPKSGPNKKTILIVVIVVVVLLIGWAAKSFFARNLAENMAERALERAGGGNLDVDFDDNTWTYETDQGTFQAGEDVALPSDWPSDVPIMSGAKITYAGSSNPSTGAPGASVMFTTSKSVSEVAAYYNGELVSQGWTIDSTVNMGGSNIISAQKGERTVAIYIVSSDGLTSVTIGVQNQ